MEAIEITIKPNGAVVIEAQGYKDNKCASDTKPFEDALKGKLKRKEQAGFNKPAAKVTNKAK